jgi:hypothetical protein
VPESCHGVEPQIEARGFVKRGQTNQRVHVRVNGVDAGELLLGWDIASTSLAIPAEALKSSFLQIEPVPETPISPARAGISSNQRLLGIGLKVPTTEGPARSRSGSKADQAHSVLAMRHFFNRNIGPTEIDRSRWLAFKIIPERDHQSTSFGTEEPFLLPQTHNGD